MSCQIKQCTVMLTEFKDFRSVIVKRDEDDLRVRFQDVVDKAEELIKDQMEKEKKPQPEDVCEGENCTCSLVSSEWGEWKDISVDPDVEFTHNGVKYYATAWMKRRTGTGKGWCRTENLKVAASKIYFEGSKGKVVLEGVGDLSTDHLACIVEITGAELA